MHTQETSFTKLPFLSGIEAKLDQKSDTSHCHRKILGALPSLTHCTVLGKLYGAVSTKKQAPVRGGTRLRCARWKAAPEVT